MHAHGIEVDGSAGKPNRLRYLALEQAGLLHCVAAWAGTEVVGYVTALVGPDLHHEDTMVVLVDALYVSPEHRSSGAGLRLLRAAMRLATDAKVVAHAVPGSAMEKLLEHSGFTARHTVYTRST